MSEATKNPAAVALGRRGGKAYAANTSKKERSESARRAAVARWSKPGAKKAGTGA